MIENSEFPQIEKAEHTALYTRSYQAPIVTRSQTVVARSLAWLLPWTVWSYPGLRKGILEVLGWRVAWQTVACWRRGERATPIWACRVISGHIRARCEKGLALADELDATVTAGEISFPRRIGFCVVDEDGLNKRNHVGINRKKDKPKAEKHQEKQPPPDII